MFSLLSPLSKQQPMILFSFLFLNFTFIFFLAEPCGMRDLSSPTRNGTHAPAGEAGGLNHWTARVVPSDLIFKKEKKEKKEKRKRCSRPGSYGIPYSDNIFFYISYRMSVRCPLLRCSSSSVLPCASSDCLSKFRSPPQGDLPQAS